MKLHHRILEKIFKFSNYSFHKMPSFRILNVHDILEKDFDNLEKIIINLKKNWQFIKPSELSIANKINQNCILLTFDDGYKSQKYFADKVLKKHSIKAIFFVITNFVKCNSKYEAKKFVLKSVDKNLDVNSIRFSEINNMNFEDLKELIFNNHLIGSHTVNHKKLTEIKDLKDLTFEIQNSKNQLESALNTKINNFAWTYGDINSINKNIYKLIKKNYQNIFSGIRGDNFKKDETSVYFRDELSPFYSEDLVKAFLNGYSDFYYYQSRKKLLNFDKDV